VGNPFGFDASVSGGIISGRGRNMHLGPYDDFLQIDAAINVGNSGGPTFDLDGRVIGINTAIYSPNGGSVGIAFAVPANLARPVIEQLSTGGRVERGWLGVRIQELTPEIAKGLGLAKPEGGLVADVTPDGPAARAGLAPGDVILSVDGRIVATKRDLLVALAAMPAGRTAEMKAWRRGTGIELHPVIGEMPETATIISYPPNESGARQVLGIGLKFGALTEARRQLLGISPEVKGVIVLDTSERGRFAHLGLRPGDVIETINQQQASSPDGVIAHLEQILASGADNVLMLIHRRGTNRFLAGSLRDSTN
jgi:serine protease Do